MQQREEFDMKMMTNLLVAGLTAVVSSGAFAKPVAKVKILGYSMPQGGGSASGGVYDYWDMGGPPGDGMAISVGIGDLNDGRIAEGPWYATGDFRGSEPYVGWLATGANQLNPTIKLHLSSPSQKLIVGIHIDNSQVGGVFAPSQVIFNGQAYDPYGQFGVIRFMQMPAPGEVGWLTFMAPNGIRNPTIQLVQVPGSWVFASEVTVQNVPEPSSWAMLIAGFGLVGAIMRRTRRAAAA